MFGGVTSVPNPILRDTQARCSAPTSLFRDTCKLASTCVKRCEAQACGAERLQVAKECKQIDTPQPVRMHLGPSQLHHNQRPALLARRPSVRVHGLCGTAPTRGWVLHAWCSQLGLACLVQPAGAAQAMGCQAGISECPSWQRISSLSAVGKSGCEAMPYEARYAGMNVSSVSELHPCTSCTLLAPWPAAAAAPMRGRTRQGGPARMRRQAD